MGPRPLLLTAAALLAVGLAAGCDGGGSPDPVPSPSPTRSSTPTTGSPVPTDENCPPIPGFLEQTVELPLRGALPLPDGGRVRLVEVAGDTVVLEVLRTTPGCREDPVRADFPERGGGTLLGLKIDVLAVNASTGGMPPTAQLRVGPDS